MSQARDFADSFSAVSTGRRNLIINGAMQVHQRGDQSISSGSAYSLDRWQTVTTGGSAAYDLQQSTDVPSNQGFSNSYKLDVTTADTAVAAGDGYIFRQQFEGQDLQHLCKGTSNAKTLTLQFWIKSSKTGTYIVELYDFDNSRHMGKSYTVNTADTWEKKTITFPADTSGTLDNDNARSLTVQFWLMAGSTYTSGTLNTSWADNVNANRAVGQVNALDSTSNNIYFTGVQLEVGNSASPFEHRSYGEELALCQRYYQHYLNPNLRGTCNSSTTAGRMGMQLPVIMRATPSVTITQTGSAGHFKVFDGSTTEAYSSIGVSYLEKDKIEFDLNVSSGLTVGRACVLYTHATEQSSFAISAEL